MVENRIKAILFDLDGVLIPEDEATNGALEQTCQLAARQCAIDPTSLRTAIRDGARTFLKQKPEHQYCSRIGVASSELLAIDPNTAEEQQPLTRGWIEEYQQKVWQQGLLVLGINNMVLANDLATDYPSQRSLLYRPYFDVEAVLATLQDSYILGIITNGLACLQKLKIEKADLKGHFSSVTISSEIGVGKPDHRIYLSAAESLGVPLKNILVVEDSPKNINGALQLCMQAVFVHRQVNLQPVPCPTIKSLKELL